MLKIKEIRLMLEIIRKQYGHGYADDREVAQLQAKLSIMLEAKLRAKGEIE